MSEASSERQRKAVAYLQRTLQMNPLFQSEEILRIRSLVLGIKTKNAAPAVQGIQNKQADRKQLLACLDKVREVCWTAPPERLQQMLAPLRLQGYPDLERTAHRLRAILASRSLLPRLTTHRHFDEKFLTCFKQVLSSPPREVAVLREQVLASFRKKDLRKRGCKMIDLLEREVPDLCALELDWLNSLRRQKSHAVQATQAASYDSSAESESGNNWWWVLVLIIILVRVLAAAAR